MKKYTLLDVVKMLKKSGTISGNCEMVRLLNKVKKDKKLLNDFLHLCSPALVGNTNLSDKIIESLL